MEFENIIGLDGINGFEVNSFLTHAHNEKFDITLVKHNNFFYAEITEEDHSYIENDGRIYELGNHWYMRFDYVKFRNDLHNGKLDPDNFDVFNYEL